MEGITQKPLASYFNPYLKTVRTYYGILEWFVRCFPSSKMFLKAVLYDYLKIFVEICMRFVLLLNLFLIIQSQLACVRSKSHKSVGQMKSP